MGILEEDPIISISIWGRKGNVLHSSKWVARDIVYLHNSIRDFFYDYYLWIQIRSSLEDPGLFQDRHHPIDILIWRISILIVCLSDGNLSESIILLALIGEYQIYWMMGIGVRQVNCSRLL